MGLGAREGQHCQHYLLACGDVRPVPQRGLKEAALSSIIGVGAVACAPLCAPRPGLALCPEQGPLITGQWTACCANFEDQRPFPKE